LEPQHVLYNIFSKAQQLVFLPFSIQEDRDMSYGKWLPPSKNVDRHYFKRSKNDGQIHRIVGLHPRLSFSKPNV
jgi:hypothetical protein